ncbi:TauD/TfdA dioxygenase family protein [Candidimonas nitroreducens]|uniref:Taurine catabolism dioxygenase n=1 Tax=Candidimonas nitroreducens TaxID=683354 RepID=A0A225M7V2_9BURK|nr:TauD/TfdA family dioxygenase [Candidimonas nitroreducens]OWT56180.1 taurine catabolism dioxygenase [Candidimonas nitroreducens]
MTLTITPISSSVLGAEVRGVDLSGPITVSDRRRIYEAWIEHAVLVVRDQKLEPGQFSAAARMFGDILAQQLKKFALPDHPEVGTISSRDLPVVDGKLHVRGEEFHTDHSNFSAPPKATILHAVNLPSRGGDTQFCDARAAYDDLDEATKAQISSLRSLHVYESTHSTRKMFKLSDKERDAMPRTSQPLVIRHAESGRPALYLNTGRMEGIEGMPDEEGYALIARLFRHATQPKFEYRHVWQPGDLVIWDNRSVLHQANADYDPTELRYLYRIMLQGKPLEAYSAQAVAHA